MISNLGKLAVVAAIAATVGTASVADTDTGTAQPVDPLLVLYPDGQIPPAPQPVRQIRVTWSTGVFR